MATTKQVLGIAQDIADNAIREIPYTSVIEHDDTGDFTDEELDLVHAFATSLKAVWA